ncbi:MAG: HD domain-containing protein [Bacteriovoracaceae bacterium]|nr:HD domain-containing protein [Bacteriovoracaceae bacterium]
MGQSQSGDMKTMKRTYFSVSFELIVTGNQLPFDLYVNSSGLDKKARFIRVFPKGQQLTAADVAEFKGKYPQLYVPESQRSVYMQTLIKSRHYTDSQKATALKDSAVDYLDRLFELEREFTTEALAKTVEQCREVVENMVEVVEEYEVDQLRNLIASLSFHDFYTYDHSINVAMYCITIYKMLHPNATRDEMTNAGLGGLLHDLGKIKIPTAILNSPNKLTEEEFEMIKKHPDFGLELLENGHAELDERVDIQAISRVVHEHHENWDGTGYPAKLKEKEISELARICAIADFFDAVTTKRSYADVMVIDEAIKIMQKTSGKKIDPHIFKIFATQFKGELKPGKFNFKMAEDFDSERPYVQFPLIPDETQKLEKEGDEKNGKVNLFDGKKKKKEAPATGKVNLFGNKKKKAS